MLLDCVLLGVLLVPKFCFFEIPQDSKAEYLDKHTVAAWLEQPQDMNLRAKLDAWIADGDPIAAVRLRLWTYATYELEPLFLRTEDWLRSKGLSGHYPSAIAPVVFIDVSQESEDLLQQMPGLVSLYPSEAYEQECFTSMFNDTATPSGRFDAVHERGILGRGATVCIIENEGVTTLNPFLPPVIRKNPNNTDQHPTAIAGIMASTSSLLPGAAPGIARILSANSNSWQDSAIIQAADWGIQNGAEILSCSFGKNTNLQVRALDRYFDYVIRNFGILMTKSNGNWGVNGPCTSPGLGYNMLAVGDISDSATATWRDDQMSLISSARNPPGREKPEVSAVGSDIYSTIDFAPWTGFTGSGTSFAAPKVAALCCLLFEMDSHLKARPEILRAITMATAWQNVEGAALLSDRDGAGGIHAAAAHRLVEGERYWYELVTRDEVTQNAKLQYAVSLRENDHARVVLCWSATTDINYSQHSLASVFELRISDPGGQEIAFADQELAAFQILEFTPPQTGIYTLAVRASSFGFVPYEPIGLALSVHSDQNTSRVELDQDLRLGQTSSIFYEDRYEPHQNFSVRASFRSFPEFIAVDQRVLPLAFDSLFIESGRLQSPYFENFQGQLDAHGQSQAPRIHIPNWNHLMGRDVHFVGLTLDLNSPSGVLHIGELQTYKIH